MTVRAIGALLLLGLVGTPTRVQLAPPDSYWPFWFEREADAAGRPERFSAWGPFLAGRREPDGQRVTSVRPFHTRSEDEAGRVGESHFLYPLYNARWNESRRDWNFLQLIRGSAPAEADAEGYRRFEVWPFFWRFDPTGDDPGYRALFPFRGTLVNRLWKDEITFTLFPLHARTRQGDETTDNLLWPFFARHSGPRSTGLEFWPFWGYHERRGEFTHRYAFWPLYYDRVDGLEEEIPFHRQGFLPFYTRDDGPGIRSATWLWPFFGYTEEFAPRPAYREIRYFWPFLVQGRGEQRHVNRWWPFYARETAGSLAKTTVLWPLYRHTLQEGSDGVIDRDQVLFFLYWDQIEQTTTRHTRRTHLWPLFSSWNENGTLRQAQVLSPLEPIFPHNRTVREVYSPLFALYRWDARPGGTTHSLLWDLVVIEHSADEGLFQLGPLLEYGRAPQGGHFEVLRGLFSYERDQDGASWKFLWRNWRPEPLRGSLP